MRLELVTSEQRFCELEPSWWALWRAADRTTPFQSPAWQIPWFRCFASHSELRAIAVHTTDGLAALLPLATFRWRGERWAAPVGAGITDYLDVLLSVSASPRVLELVWEGLSIVLREVDRLELADVPARSPLAEVVRDRAGATVEPHAVCPVVRLEPELGAYRERLPKWLRRSLGQGRRALLRLGFSWRRAEEASLDAMLNDLFELHTARWQARGEAGVLGDPAVREFHRQAAPRLLRAGLLRLFVLDVGGGPAGAAYVLHGEDAYLYASGFRPELQDHSIGNLLIEYALGDAHSAGKRRCDFLRGAERYKYVWGAQDEVTRRISIQGGLA